MGKYLLQRHFIDADVQGDPHVAAQHRLHPSHAAERGNGYQFSLLIRQHIAFKNVGKQVLFEKPVQDRGKSSVRSEEHTSELQSRFDLVCRLLLEKKKK